MINVSTLRKCLLYLLICLETVERISSDSNSLLNRRKFDNIHSNPVTVDANLFVRNTIASTTVAYSNHIKIPTTVLTTSLRNTIVTSTVATPANVRNKMKLQYNEQYSRPSYIKTEPQPTTQTQITTTMSIITSTKSTQNCNIDTVASQNLCPDATVIQFNADNTVLKGVADVGAITIDVETVDKSPRTNNSDLSLEAKMNVQKGREEYEEPDSKRPRDAGPVKVSHAVGRMRSSLLHHGAENSGDNPALGVVKLNTLMDSELRLKLNKSKVEMPKDSSRRLVQNVSSGISSSFTGNERNLSLLPGNAGSSSSSQGNEKGLSSSPGHERDPFSSQGNERVLSSSPGNEIIPKSSIRNETISTKTVDTSSHHGGNRPSTRPSFSTELFQQIARNVSHNVDANHNNNGTIVPSAMEFFSRATSALNNFVANVTNSITEGANIVFSSTPENNKNDVFGATVVEKYEFLRINGQSVPHVFVFERSCRDVIAAGGGCQCVRGCSAIDSGGVCASASGSRASSSSVPNRCCCVGPQARQIPQNFSRDLISLFFYNVGILEIREDDFNDYSRLEEIVIDSAHELRNVEGGAFSGLRNLSKISITNCENLERWSGTILKNNRRLRSIVARGNALVDVPVLQMANVEATAMELIDFSANHISVVGGGAFRNLSVRELRLQENRLQRVDAHAFVGSRFTKLSLNDNPNLVYISPEAFEHIERLSHLDLSNTHIDRMPVLGLKNIEQLTLRNVPTLKKLPPVLAFIHLSRAEFTYPYHCCFFKHAARQLQNKRYFEAHFNELQRRQCIRHLRKLGESDVSVPIQSTLMPRILKNGYNSGEIFADDSEENEDEENEAHFGGVRLAEGPLGAFARAIESTTVGAVAAAAAGSLLLPLLKFVSSGASWEQSNIEGTTPKVGQTKAVLCPSDLVSEFYSNVTCTPQPDALNPCEDIVSYYPLRCVIWLMWISGIIGNIAVWIVIAAVWKRQMRLHYFFMLNVSFADFLTGVYLAILAITDWKTSNEYYNYAVEWQTGWGCSAAGFISVFASQLSIFSMLLIAVEIYYNAKYAFYGRRMSCKVACFLMGLGYTYAFTMAILPLLGVSSYEHSSICLPLSINTRLDQAYILLGLSLSAMAFASMVANYALINCMIRNREMPSRDEDRQILRRTIVLIGTDMICWVPTLFLGITAALGMPLITLTNAKICLILFYPINSCANPLLYVFLTQIWRDAKRKALPIFEIISSKSQNFSRNNPANLLARCAGGANNATRLDASRRRTTPPHQHQHVRSHSDYISNFYYSAPPSLNEERRQSDGDYDGATRALLGEASARITADSDAVLSDDDENTPTTNLESESKFSFSTPQLSQFARQSFLDETEIPDPTGGVRFQLGEFSNHSDNECKNATAFDKSNAVTPTSSASASDASLGLGCIFNSHSMELSASSTTPNTSNASPILSQSLPQSQAKKRILPEEFCLLRLADLGTVRAARVSAVPDMSDISESSSNSFERLHYQHSKNGRQIRQKKMKNSSAVTQSGSRSERCDADSSKHDDARYNSSVASTAAARNVATPRVSTAKRDSDTSIGRDSGRGDSLTSCVLHFMVVQEKGIDSEFFAESNGK